MNEQEAQWRQQVAADLAAGRCPDSGQILHMEGEGPQGSASCDMCDCFGYDPNRVKVHPRPLRVVRWKMTRKTCNICKRGFSDNTGSSLCGPCFSEAVGLPLVWDLFR